MYPSCSNYGLMVFNEKPFFSAIYLTADRLTRCSHDQTYYDQTYAYGYKSTMDYPYYKVPPKKLIYKNRPPVYAEQLKGGANRDSTRLFINHLINEQNYEVALLEIERNFFFTRPIPRTLYLQKLLCYEALNMEEKGVFEYEANFPDSIKKDTQISFKIAKLYDNIENEKGAMSILDQTCIASSDSSAINRAYVFKALISAKSDDIHTAKRLLEESQRYASNPMYNENMSILQHIENTKKKHPTTAKILSVVPGAGYLYTGHKGTALTSFAINTLLAYSTYTSIKSENYGVATLCGFINLSFYIGNIKGAGKSAKRYNQKKKEKQINQLYKINNIHYY